MPAAVSRVSAAVVPLSAGEPPDGHRGRAGVPDLAEGGSRARSLARGRAVVDGGETGHAGARVSLGDLVGADSPDLSTAAVTRLLTAAHCLGRHRVPLFGASDVVVAERVVVKFVWKQLTS